MQRCIGRHAAAAANLTCTCTTAAAAAPTSSQQPWQLEPHHPSQEDEQHGHKVAPCHSPHGVCKLVCDLDEAGADCKEAAGGGAEGQDDSVHGNAWVLHLKHG
jgi:hypothetical protein